MSGAIGRAALNGTSVQTSFIATGATPYGFTVDSTRVYWANGYGGTSIGRANLDGTAVNQALVSGADTPYGLAVNSRWLYWANQGADDGRTIGRSDLSGDDPDQSFIVGREQSHRAGCRPAERRIVANTGHFRHDGAGHRLGQQRARPHKRWQRVADGERLHRHRHFGR